MITRFEAVIVLEKLTDSDIISDDLKESLYQIIHGITVGDRERDFGLDIWGAKDNDYQDLYVYRRMWRMGSRQCSDTMMKHLENTYERYRIKENKVTFDEWLKG